MAAKSGTKHSTTLPDGTKATRTSGTHVYTHAVVVQRWEGCYPNARKSDSWKVENWCGSEDLALKALRVRKIRESHPEAVIVPVEVVQ